MIQTQIEGFKMKRHFRKFYIPIAVLLTTTFGYAEEEVTEPLSENDYSYFSDENSQCGFNQQLTESDYSYFSNWGGCDDSYRAGTGLYFRADSTKTLVLKDVVANGRMCAACGSIELFGDENTLRQNLKPK